MRRSTESLAVSLVENAQEEDPSRGRILQELIRLRERIRSIAQGIEDRAIAHVEEHRRHVVSQSNRARRNLLMALILTALVEIYLVLFLPSRVVRSFPASLKAPAARLTTFSVVVVMSAVHSSGAFDGSRK